MKQSQLAAQVGVGVIMLVIGAAIGSIAFPTTRTDTTLQLSTVTVAGSTTVTTVVALSSYTGLVYAANIGGYFPNSFVSKEVNITNLKNGENFTLEDVRFQFIVNQNDYLTTEGNQVYAVTADYVCPSMFIAYFPDGKSLSFSFCPHPWMSEYPNGAQWSVSIGTVPTVAVSIQLCDECEVEIAVAE